jgi:MbtH protein
MLNVVAVFAIRDDSHIRGVFEPVAGRMRHHVVTFAPAVVHLGHRPGRRDHVSSPFDDESGTYLVLVNDEGQHSLWPAFVGVPAGWRVARAAGDRAGAVAHIEANWSSPSHGKSQNDSVKSA